MKNIELGSTTVELTENEMTAINGGSEFSEWVIEKLSYLMWRRREVHPNVARGNYNGTYWNCGMRSVI